MDQRQNEKKNYKLQEPRYNFLYANEKKKKKKNLTLTCQTRAIIEKNIGIN